MHIYMKQDKNVKPYRGHVSINFRMQRFEVVHSNFNFCNACIFDCQVMIYQFVKYLVKHSCFPSLSKPFNFYLILIQLSYNNANPLSFHRLYKHFYDTPKLTTTKPHHQAYQHYNHIYILRIPHFYQSPIGIAYFALFDIYIIVGPYRKTASQQWRW